VIDGDQEAGGPTVIPPIASDHFEDIGALGMHDLPQEAADLDALADEEPHGNIPG
jgi:hypothetical protein